MASDGGLTDTSGRTSETQVSIPPTITYGLQETHTTVLPAICWFSAPNLLTNFVPKTFAFRLNSIYDLMTVGTISTAIQDGDKFWTKKCGETAYAGTTGAATGYDFPSEGWTEFYPWYRDTWEKLYSYYTVLGCEYEIVISNPGISGRKALIAYSVQTTGSNQSTSVSLPTITPLKHLYGMKNIQYEEVHGRDNGVGKNNVSIIKGTYKPGTALRDISNDGDVKLWLKTDETGAAGETPVYSERMQVMSYLHPLSTAGSDADGVFGSATAPDFFRSDVHLNYQVRLKYIVQFKQLRQSVRYPIAGSTNTQNIQFPAAGNPYTGV